MAIGINLGITPAPYREQRTVSGTLPSLGELATYLRGDPYEAVWQVDGVDPSKCNNNCDVKAECSCGLVYGDYKCGCFKGFAGSWACWSMSRMSHHQPTRTLKAMRRLVQLALLTLVIN
ncbi:hypothetical protein OS493_033383 [Desmophyllum pertusum]|uniref:Uncharacterized protein n=1 Tax=Desmophyllum pertusum TaxID=174260 RepID=A0A9W9YJ50_9CNID|nr:hypothetical protein OS493_033383 [Desmophyllum pertusum]